MSQRPRRGQLSLPMGAAGTPVTTPVMHVGNGARAQAVSTAPKLDAALLGGPQPDRLLFTVPEAARALHIGRRQAWEMVWRGELPVVRLGRSVRIARPILERFVVEQSRPYGA